MNKTKQQQTRSTWNLLFHSSDVFQFRLLTHKRKADNERKANIELEKINKPFAVCSDNKKKTETMFRCVIERGIRFIELRSADTFYHPTRMASQSLWVDFEMLLFKTRAVLIIRLRMLHEFFSGRAWNIHEHMIRTCDNARLTLSCLLDHLFGFPSKDPKGNAS